MWLARAVPSSSQWLTGGCAASTAEISTSPARAGPAAAAVGLGRAGRAGSCSPVLLQTEDRQDRMAKPESGVGSGWQEVRELWPGLVHHKKFRAVSEASGLSAGLLWWGNSSWCKEKLLLSALRSLTAPGSPCWKARLEVPARAGITRCSPGGHRECWTPMAGTGTPRGSNSCSVSPACWDFLSLQVSENKT